MHVLSWRGYIIVFCSCIVCLLIYFASDIYRLSLSNDFSSLRLKEYDIILTDV